MARHRILRLLCSALLLSLVAAGCASSSKEPKGALTRIVETGVIRVGMTGEQPPLTMISRDGEFLGLDVALMRVLARNMGVEAKFQQIRFDDLLDALDRGEIDAVMSGMTITPDRVERVAFIGPYFTSGKTVLTRSKSIANAQTPQDIDRSGLRVAALQGSTSETFARDSFPSAKLVTTARLDEAIGMVVNGDVDALVADRETCFFAVLRNPDAGLIASTTAFTVEPMGIAVPLDQPQLANLIQTYFDALSETEALGKAKAFWFQDPAWVKSLR